MEKIDKLELPNQLVAVLADPLLQKLLLLRPSAESFQRVANWLNAALQDVIDGDADEATLWEVMEVVRDFVVQTKVSDACISWGRGVVCSQLLMSIESAVYCSQLFCAILYALEWTRESQVHL